MNRRSLLDYIDDKEMPPAGSVAQPRAEWLEHRLAELESRLAAARVEAEAARQSQPAFSSQIESILKRQSDRMPQPRAAAAEMPAPARSDPQRDLSPRSYPSTRSVEQERSLEFTKFVEAVHLIGQAAKRFLHEPPVPRQPAGPSEDTLALTAALKDTIAAFQAMTADLASAASQMRRPAPLPQARVEAPQPSRSREDEELRRLEHELADLRERLGALSRRSLHD